jgi:hypothetical protein
MKYLKTKRRFTHIAPQLKDLKLVCIKDSPPYITIGKTYQLIEYENSLGDLEYYYVGDNNEEINFHYQTEKFITLEQYREQQLDKLGIK